MPLPRASRETYSLAAAQRPRTSAPALPVGDPAPPRGDSLVPRASRLLAATLSHSASLLSSVSLQCFRCCKLVYIFVILSHNNCIFGYQSERQAVGFTILGK